MPCTGALMAFESFITSYASRTTPGCRPRVFKPDESKVVAAGAPLYGRKSVSETVESSISHGGAATPAERKCEPGIAIQPMNPRTARELVDETQRIVIGLKRDREHAGSNNEPCPPQGMPPPGC